MVNLNKNPIYYPKNDKNGTLLNVEEKKDKRSSNVALAQTTAEEEVTVAARGEVWEVPEDQIDLVQVDQVVELEVLITETPLIQIETMDLLTVVQLRTIVANLLFVLSDWYLLAVLYNF
ncbi:hypothetical protein NQ315_008383 [Exocentrus adspersus]|uniref:Uncharacterized protein n=1 Tax=Exocentrus adspersus TaxID=1586481 RepID=A0AAV8VRF1_9CUCU|nr:hypothetical protein NQ315_008383 [Exocentrus adspersus]